MKLFLLLGSERYSKEKPKFWVNHCKRLSGQPVLMPGEKEGGEMQHKQVAGSALVPAQPLVWCVTQKSFNLRSFPRSLKRQWGKQYYPHLLSGFRS